MFFKSSAQGQKRSRSLETEGGYGSATTCERRKQCLNIDIVHFADPAASAAASIATIQKSIHGIASPPELTPSLTDPEQRRKAL